jgi:predicted flap endonuclease-1-like 5' DNA nuclease
MSYLLWQLFLCLLGTALLFFVIGWLVRGWFKRTPANDNLITDSERSSFQSSLDGGKARLEAETGRRLAAEKALEDSRGQQAKISSLLDQHTAEIKTLMQELADKGKAVEQGETRAADLERQLAERDAKLKSLEAEIAETTPKLAAALAAGTEVIALRARIADLEPKLSAAAEENGKLRVQVSEFSPKMAMAAAAGAEVVALKSQLAQLEPQASKLQASDMELGKLRSELADLQQKLEASTNEANDLNKKLSILQTSGADTTKHLSELDARNRSFADENEKLKAELAAAVAAGAEVIPLKSHIHELEGKLHKAHAHEAEAAKTRLRIAELEPKLAAATASANEATSLKVHIMELEGKLARSHAGEAEKIRWVEQEGKWQAIDEENARLKAQLAGYDGELTKLRVRVGELEPQVHNWETRYATTVAQKDAELSQCRGRVAELEQQSVPVALEQQPAPTVERDDLKRIYGIGPVLERRLNSLGVFFFREIAQWTKEDIVRYEEHLKEFRDRIERDHWVEGAREEHFKKYGERLGQANAASA